MVKVTLNKTLFNPLNNNEMKYNPSIAFDEMSGSAKGVTAAKTRGRKYIRNRDTAAPPGPRSSLP